MNAKKFYSLFAIVVLFAIMIVNVANAQRVTYSDNWSDHGFNLVSADNKQVNIDYSVTEFSIESISIEREQMVSINMPGHLLPNDEGMPNLPGKGRYIAIPQGATPKLTVLNSRTEMYKDVNLAPAPRIPWDTEKGPLTYEKNAETYAKNAFYPENPVTLSEVTRIRGVDVVMLGVTPFQYNPVTKELIVYRDLQVEVSFEGGNGQFGNDRYRSRWFDPILEDAVLNSSSLPEIDYSNRHAGASRDDGCEYLIVIPDGADFQQWADSIKLFRSKQGILTDIVTLTEIGGSTVNDLEAYFNNAFNTWTIPPAAVLLLADYGNNANNSIISPIWNSYCVSDNIFADVNNNDMPDIVFARITANNADELETMVTKFLNYERNPPTNPDFYNHPITALGWQTERWFQICSESIGGFFKNEQGKDPVRINEIYGGNPNTDPWSTAPNTNAVIAQFGPAGLGYIPASPQTLGNWSGGSSQDVINAINDGSFLLQHRDHGWEQGWGEPSFSNSNINSLTNTDLTFIMSINCLTGKYNWGNECFTEKFHRHTSNGLNSGALGLIAASEVSYSFVNDTYVWGAYDNMWPEFLPDYGTTPESRGVLPAFGNAAAKYFLQQSSWPYNTGNKEVTYNLFHHHGDAFLQLYSEVPQNLTVVHNDVLLGGATSFSVTADDDSFIALSVNGEIIGTEEGTGTPVVINIEPQLPGDVMIVTVTKQNYFRYESAVNVIPPDGAYCIYEENTFADENENGQMDYAEAVYFSLGIKNHGNDDASNVSVTLSTTDPYINITDNTEEYGAILSTQTVTVDSGFMINVADDIPDMHLVIFDVTATDGTDTWVSSFVGEFHAPVVAMGEIVIDDASGNNNGRIDPGETVDILIDVDNWGTSDAYNVIGTLTCEDDYIVINESSQSYGDLSSGGDATQGYSVTALETTPGGYTAEFTFNIAADHGIDSTSVFELIVGQFAALILDLDPGNNSGPQIFEAFEATELIADYATEIPTKDLIIYKSIFLSLGIYYSNYVLTPDQGQLLADYLLEGGNLYMEGRLTWIDEPQTVLHDMFGLEVVEGNWYEFEQIYGVEEEFTTGMFYDYQMGNPYVKFHFEPNDPAYVIFSGEEDGGQACGVANDAGDYKTIAASHEFGGLIDGEYPSEKAVLLQRYLEFFGVMGSTVSVDELPGGSLTGEIACYPNPAKSDMTFTFELTESSNVELQIFNLNGQLVKAVANGTFDKGLNKIYWNGSDDAGNLLNSGLYLYKMKTNDQVISGKVSIVR